MQAQSHPDPPPQDRLRATTQAPKPESRDCGVAHTKGKNRCFVLIVLMMRERLAETGLSKGFERGFYVEYM